MTLVANVRSYRGSMADAVYVGRPSPYGNPWRAGKHGTRAQVIELFRTWWYADVNIPIRAQAVVELQNKVLLCWCVPLPCHADVIAEFVNEYWKAA